MRTCRVDELFKVEYGVNLELNSLDLDPNGINFVARTSKNNGVTARVKHIIGIEPAPAGTISVAGGGSVMESFLQESPFYSGRDLFYLTPLVPMTTAEKLYYCLCLRRNKFKFSYGRQANETLPSLRIPVLEDVPGYVRRFSMEAFGRRVLGAVDTAPLAARASRTWSGKLVELSELFEIKNGIASTGIVRSARKEDERWVPFVRPSYRQSTSIDAYVNRIFIPSDKLFPRGTLYVSTNGQGSHTYAYVSVSEFVPNSDVSVLLPKRPMTLREKLAYALFITRNRFKFSYGRKPKGAKLMTVRVPDAIPPAWNGADLEARLRGRCDPRPRGRANADNHF